MFWKKRPAVAKPTEAKTEVPKPEKKKISPKDVITDQIEQLGAGQTLMYKVPEAWGGDLIYIELNPQYPQKGKKYVLGTEKLADGKPSGIKTPIGDSNKPMELAAWVVDRKGEPFIEAGEVAISS